jgi:hypothetical protein
MAALDCAGLLRDQAVSLLSGEFEAAKEESGFDLCVFYGV